MPAKLPPLASDALRGSPEAVAICRRWRVDEWQSALLVYSQNPVEFNDLGKALEKAGLAIGAMVAFALAENAAGENGFSPATFNRGRIAARLGDLRAAEKYYRQVLTLDSPDAGALCNLGNIVARAGDYDQGLELLQRAADAAPSQAFVEENLNTLRNNAPSPVERAQMEGQRALDHEAYPEAVAHFERALKLGAARGPVLLAMAQANLYAHDFDAASRLANEAAIDMPRDPLPAWTNLHAKFAQGDWEAGWKIWREEWRPRVPVPLGENLMPWRGERGDSIRLRVICDQGAGDALMTARLLPWVRGRVGSFTLVAPKRYHRILSPWTKGTTVLSPKDSLGDATHHVAMTDLPAWHGGTPESMPSISSNSFAQITAHPSIPTLIERGDATERLVGIAWQGNRKYADDARRSIPLDFFRSLAQVEGVRLISLQHGEGREQLVDWPELPDLGANLDPGPDAFVETLGLLRKLDLLITSDSVLAHLGGIAGIPVWLLLTRMPDWRWTARGGRTGWYGSLRLYRQSKPGDWKGVFETITEDLGALVLPAMRQSPQ